MLKMDYSLSFDFITDLYRCMVIIHIYIYIYIYTKQETLQKYLYERMLIHIIIN